ncbi:sensor histidine kinase [Alcaligenes faecalis]|uniref:sensor histidine kinase n=1 Tax=Alcaligenes faecalis TaxID=511 RepID=UPI002932224D|nr:HAMP domain-containing sensor histidine kinase [Alcaligenes faecalis]MDV2116562.1 HAMP domain-containing sensor histidine kinase [Alcaligenes faecalis]
MAPLRPLHSRFAVRALAVWGLLVVLAACALAAWRYQSLISILETESNVLYRLASQRADQHDAHLTALSAVANATEDTRHTLFLEVAATIAHFYPRIEDIQLVPLAVDKEPVGLGVLSPEVAALLRESVLASAGQMVLMADPQHPGFYLLAKRSPNTADARYGLMLRIDASKLLAEANHFWSTPGVFLRLSLPDGDRLVDLPVSDAEVRFSKVLASRSQPLMLATGMALGPGDFFPLLDTTLVLLLLSAVYLVALAAWRQRWRTRMALEQARLSALESRLAHASRVNALGEMASGLAHELTQPLTAILAQAQASRRILAQASKTPLMPVLDETVAQAKRASAILERFRNWSRPQALCVVPFDIRDALLNVRALLASQAAISQTRLTFEMPPDPVLVEADPVEIEQVVFNLVRNGLDAVARQEAGYVTVGLKKTEAQLIVDVCDNGPGVLPELKDSLFTPFTTSRPDGTGLGLALSQRLIERAHGEVFLLDGAPETTFRIILPLKREPMESAG